MNINIESLYASIPHTQESERIPKTAGLSMSAVLLSRPLPSTKELERRGKLVIRASERWRSLEAGITPTRAMHVSHFPGTRQHALMALFETPLHRFVSWRDLVDADIGRWHDVQLFKEGRLLAFSLREESCVFRFAGRGLPPLMTDCFGDLTDVSPEWFRFLNSPGLEHTGRE